MIVSGTRPSCALLCEITNRPGVLEKITDIILHYGFNIVKIYTPETITGAKGYLVIVLENCVEENMKSLIGSIMSEAKGLVLNVTGVSSSTNGFLFPPFGDIVFGDRRACLLTLGMIREVSSAFLKDPSTASMGKIWLKSLGEALGKQIYLGWVKYFLVKADRWEDQVQTAIQQLAEIYHALGYGELEVAEVVGLKYRLIVYRDIFCHALSELKTLQKCGYITGGIFSGFFRELFGRRANVVEKECLCMGKDKCVHEIELFEPEPAGTG